MIAGNPETAYFEGDTAGSPGAARRRSDARPTRDMAPSPQPVVIKLHGNRRLYRPDTGGYVTLDDLTAMVEDDEDFAVCEARTGDDITPTILKQIIRKRALHDEV
jgi:PHB accumulation regulatory protein